MVRRVPRLLRRGRGAVVNVEGGPDADTGVHVGVGASPHRSRCEPRDLREVDGGRPALNIACDGPRRARGGSVRPGAPQPGSRSSSPGLAIGACDVATRDGTASTKKPYDCRTNAERGPKNGPGMPPAHAGTEAHHRTDGQRPDPGQVVNLPQDRVTQYVAELLAAAPPLTPAQRDRLASLLAPEPHIPGPRAPPSVASARSRSRTLTAGSSAPEPTPNRTRPHQRGA